MRAFTSRAKRMLALLLAVLLLVPTMAVHIHADEHGSAELMLSELIVANYDKLSAAEKAILSSGVLKNDLKLDAFPTLEGNSEIELNAEEKTISAEAYSHGDYTWTPVSATIYADGVEKETIKLTNGKGSYTYDGNTFYVDVTYSLSKVVADDDQAGHLALLNVAYNLYQDVTYLQQVTSKKDSLTMNGIKYSAVQLLNVLTDANIGSAMGLNGTIIDQINELGTGIDEAFELPDGSEGEIYIQLSEEAVEAAAALKAQQDENGGLALAKFFAKYGSLSMLEIVAEHEEELKAALLDSYSNVKALADALPDLVGQVDDTVTSFEKRRGYLEKIYTYIYEVLSDVKDSYPEAGLDSYLADKKITSDEIKSLIATLDAEYKGVINEINAALEGTGYTVTCAADIEGIIADMNGKLDNLVDEVNKALEGTGYSIHSADDLAGLIAEFEGKLETALAEINAELAKLKDIDPELDFEVSSAAELGQVISILEAYLAEKEGELADALAELNKVLNEETGYEKEVTSVAGAQEAVVWMEEQVAAYVADLNELLKDTGYTVKTSADIDTIVADISEQLTAGKKDLADALAELNKALEGTDYTVKTSADIDTIVAGIEDDMAEALAEVETTVNSNPVVKQFGLTFTFKTKADVENAIAALTPYTNYPMVGASVSEVITTLEDVVAELERGEEGIATLKDAKAGLVEAENAIATAEDLISDLNSAKADFVEAENTIADFKAGVDALADAEALLADAEAAIPALKTAQNELATAETALKGLKEAKTLLEKAEDGIAAMETAQDALAELETVKSNLNAVVELEAKVAELKQMGEALSTLSTAFGMLVADGILDEAVATRDWAAGDHIDTAAAESADYQALTEAATRAAKTKAYTNADVAKKLHIMDGTQRASMSMHDVTVNVVLKVVNANNEMVDYTITGVITLPDLTSKAVVAKEIEKIEKNALAQWSGVYVAGKYTAGSPEIPEELTGDLVCTITYNPVGVSVNYLGTEKTVPYGTTLTLEPYTANAALVYDYYVNGVKYLQGAKIVVKDELTVTRELGKAYQTASLYNVLAAQFGETQILIDLLNSGSVDVANEFYSVRYPENSDNLVTTTVGTDTVVEAQSFASGYGDLKWIPSVVHVYGASRSHAEVPFRDGKAVVEGVYEHLEVEYKLELGLDSDEILDLLNEFVAIHDEAVDQLADMATMVKQMSQLGLVTAAMNLFREEAALQATKAAIDYVNGPACVNENTGKLYLVDHVNAYADTTSAVHGLYYYYLNSTDIIKRLSDLIPNIETVIADPNFDEFLKGYSDLMGDMDIDTIVQGIKDLADSLASHPTNELIVDAQGVAKALGKGTIPSEPAHLNTKLGEYAALPEGDPALVTNLVQSPVGQVAVNVTITLKDETGVGEPHTITKFFLENALLEADDIAAIVAEAEKYCPEEWERDWHTVVSDTGSESYDLEQRLNTYKTTPLTSDVNISYVWSFACDHANVTKATCVEGSYCLTCGIEVSGPDLEHGHKLTTSVTTAPSCEKDGVETTSCSLCGMTTTEPIAKLGHNWGSYKSNNDATCTEDGTETRYCQRSGCGAHETRTKEGSATGHKYVDSWITGGAEHHIRYCENCRLPETHKHEWETEGEVTLAATCTAEGEMTYECTANGCTETKTEAIAALGHDFSGDFFYTEDGHGHLCVNCGEQGGTITAHTYATTDCTVRAECTAGCGYHKAKGEHVWAWTTAGEKYGIGSHTRTCENCGKTETADHVWDDGVITTEPGCESTGIKTHLCTLCSEDWLETLPKGAHEWGKWYADGDQHHSRDCSNCGEVQSEAHNMNNRVITVAPTCDVHGEATYYCDVCNHAVFSTTEEEDLAALGHDMGEYVSNNDATCTTDGTKTAECKRCGHTETVVDEGTALGHDYSGELVNFGAEGHAHKCVRCGEVNPVKSAHEFEYEGEAECDKEAKCACGEIKAAGQHDYEAKNDHGDEQHSLVCKVCGDTIYADHSWSSYVVTAPACETPGVEGHTCLCGHYYETEIAATGHTWGEYELDGETTCTEGGTETRHCQFCDATETRDVPAAGHTWDSYENLGAAGHIPVCSVCGEKGELTEHVWVKDEENSTPSTQVEVCVCGETRSELVGSAEVGGNRGVVNVTLHGNANDAQYAIEYTINLGTFNGEELTITVTLNSDMTYSISDLAQEAAIKYGYAVNTLRSFVWSQYQAGNINVSWKLIDKYAATLVTFVQALNADGVKGAIDFSLVETDEGYAIYANVTNAAGATGAIQNLVMALASGGYNYIGFNNHEGVDQMFYDVSGPAVSLQGLIDGILAQDGFGTDTLTKVVNANGTLNPAFVHKYDAEQILVGGKIGGVLQTATINLGVSASNIQQSLPFYLTITDTAMIGQLIPALEAASAVVSIYTRDGAFCADLTLPEKVYEAYIAAALLTGEVNKNDMEAVKAEAAFNYLYSYIKAITAPGVTSETLENTAAKLGVNVDLSAYAGILNVLIAELNSVNEVTSDNRDLKSIDLSVPGKTVIDGLLSATGMNLGSMASMLEMIVEYKAGGTLDLSMTAALAEGEYDFEVAVIDVQNGSALDKIDLAENGAARINKLAGTAVVMLLSDIEGDLVFNHTTILDLNGKTVNGSIKAKGNLIIVDSTMPNAQLDAVTFSRRAVAGYGSVNGSVSGNVTILGGCYSGDVSAFLPEGYIVENGCVRNAFYKITSDGTNLYVTVDPTAIPTSSDGLVELAMDIAVDLLLNYYSTASFALDGNEVFGVNLPEILGMISGSDTTELINTLINCIKFDGGLDYFINAITADLLDFGAIAKGEIFSHGITTKAWNLELVYVAAEDYLDFTINSVNTINDFNLNIAVVHDSKWFENLFTLLGDTLDVGFVVDFEQPVYAPGSISIGGSANAHANLVLSDTSDYVMAFALLLTYRDAKVMDALRGNVDLAYVQNVFNKMTVGQFCDVLKALQEDVTFHALAKKVGWTYGTETVGLNELHLVLTAMGEMIDSLRNAAEARNLDLDRIMNVKMSSFLQADGTYAYGFDKAATTGTVSGVNYTLGDSGVNVSADIFPEAYSVTYVDGSDVVFTDAAYAGFNYALVDLALTKEGYTFKGWKLDGKTYVAGDTFSFDGDVTLTAVWEKKSEPGPGPDEPEVDTYYVKYSVTNAPAGFKAPATKWYEAGETVTVADQPSVDGYEFYGWYLNGELITTGSFKMPAKNVTLTGWFEGASDCCHWYHCPSSWYVDLDVNAWYHSATDYVICRGLMIGVQHEPEMLFAPHMATSRAMIVTTLYRLEGSPEVEYTGHYTDVADDLWYSDAIVWATNNGIVEGYGNGIFGPNDYVTREQICTIFFRYANFKGIDTSARADISEFVDADQVSDWALEAVQWDVATGMIRGMSETEKVLSPETDTERVQMATLLMRWCKKFNA